MSEVLVIYLPAIMIALPIERTKAPRQHKRPCPVAVASCVSNEALLSDMPTIVQDPATGEIRKIIADTRELQIILPDGACTTVRELCMERVTVEFIPTATTTLSPGETFNENDVDARFQIEGRIISLLELGEYCMDNAIFLGLPPHSVRSALKIICDHMGTTMSSRQRRTWTDMRRVLDLMVTVQYGSGPGIRLES